MGRVHLRVEFDWSTCRLLGVVGPVYREDLPLLHIVLRRGNIVSNSSSRGGMVTPKVVGANGPVCSLSRISGPPIL